MTKIKLFVAAALVFLIQPSLARAESAVGPSAHGVRSGRLLCESFYDPTDPNFVACLLGVMDLNACNLALASALFSPDDAELQALAGECALLGAIVSQLSLRFLGNLADSAFAPIGKAIKE